MRILFAVIVVLAAVVAPPARAADANAEPTIELPPMIVSDSVGHRPWRYVTGGGLEVLSRCDDDTTRDLVARNDRLNQLLNYILAPELQFHTAAPRLMLVVDADMAPSLSQNLVTQFGRVPAGHGRQDGAANQRSADRPAARVSLLPNLQLEDVDLLAVFAIVDQRNFDTRGITYAPEYVLQLLQRRTPPLPDWFVVGFMTLFRQISFGVTDLTVAPFTWATAAEDEALKYDPDAPRPLMPMLDFFAYRLGSGSAAQQQRWQAQAALFVRWSLDPAHPERRAALWQFVNVAAEDGESDALARRCFQLGYSDLRDRLSDYLPVALKQELELRPPKLSRPPRLRVRDATPAEVARMKGEWERLEVSFVAKRHPEYAAQYAQLARQTLATGLERTPDDAGVLTARGLLESDLHDPNAARPYLEAAVAAGAVRPRVLVELAKFRLADALEPADHDPLSVGKAQVVLEPLQRALAEQPPLADVYALAAEVWARSRAVPNPAQWGLLLEGMRRFPGNLRLLAYAAGMKANAGDFATALAWVDKAVARSRGSPQGEAALLKLRDSILRAQSQHPAPAAANVESKPSPGRGADRR